MKNLVIALTLMFSIFTANAQERAGAPEKPVTIEQKVEKAMGKLTQELTLTPAQQKQVRTYVTGFYAEREKLASLKQTDKKEYVETLSAKAEGYLADIKKTLNAEQGKKFDSMLDKFREKHESKN
jgi:Spy/CpxP family protein refolding chaperone